MSVRLFVGNLPYNATESELREHFSAAGQVSYISLPTDRETGRPRGFAFIEFNDRSQAEDAIRRFNNQSFQGRPISVSEARAREDRPPGGGFTRPAAPRPTQSAESDAAPSPSPGVKRNRDFGPDASPQRSNKGKGGPRPGRAPKGPMREMVRGQFFSGEDDADDLYDDDDDLYEDDDHPREEEPEEESKEASNEDGIGSR